MRLLHFAETGAVVGGAERYLETLLAADVPDLEHAVVTHGGGPCEYAGPWPSFAWPWLAPRAKAGPGPGVQDATPLFHAPPSPATLADLGDVPYAVFCHDHRWWCPSGSRFHLRTHRACAIHASWAACGLRYHLLRCGSLRPGPTVANFARAAMARTTLAGAGAVLCASQFMVREAVRHGARSTRTHLVPLPVAVPPDPTTPAPDDPVILAASRLTPEKGIAELLDAFALVRTPARLVIVGDGIEAEALADAAAVHPAAHRISFAGRLGPGAMRDALAAATLVAMPSVWPEPFGLVGIEALALGRPVVSSGTGGSADWSREDLGVLTADPTDPAALALALDRALTEPEWTRRAREVGAPWVAERHGMAAHVAALTAALATLAGRSRAA